MVNLHKKTIIPLLILISLALPLTSFGLLNRLPELGESESQTFTPQDESRLGQEFMAEIRNNTAIDQDPIINDYINTLGFRLASHSPNPSHVFHFFVIDSPVINAFSGPSGYVGIFSGLILKTQNESELASVIAHELGHVVQNHIARGFVEQRHLQLSNIAAMLAAIAIGTINPNAAIGIMGASTAGSIEKMFKYSRMYEEEADRIGLQILAASGFNPLGMPLFMERIQKENQMNDEDSIPPLLRSHPVTEERLSDMYNRCDQLPKFKLKANPEFSLVQARLIVNRSTDPFVLVKQYRNLIKQNKASLRSRYVYALALLKVHNCDQAHHEIDRLIHDYPNETTLQITKAEIEHANQKDQQALNLLSKLYRYNPDYYPVFMTYAQLLLNQKPQQAMIILENNIDAYPNNEHFLQLLSKAQALAGYKMTAFETRADLYLLYGNRHMARAQLEMALKYAKNNKFAKEKIRGKLSMLKRKTEQ